MRNVLVTGGAGFIGSNFVRYLLKAEPDVRIFNLDALSYAGSLENLRDLPDESKHFFVHGDICDEKLVINLLRENQIDTVVHFAAESHVDRSVFDPAPFIQTNVVGTFTLLEAARQAWSDALREAHRSPAPVSQAPVCREHRRWRRGATRRQGKERSGRRFHHVSTDEVFGSLADADPAFSESTAYDPRSPYSASKAASDHLVRAYFHTYGLPVTISNCSNNYGPYQFPEKLIPLVILNALRGKPLPLYGDGKQIRDWLFVDDHCEAIHLVLKRGRLGETYNISGGNQLYNIDVVRKICTVLDELKPAPRPYADLITSVPDRPGHDRRYAMDITKIRTELGWNPKHDLESGLRATVQWYLAHMDWVEAIVKQADFSSWLEQNYARRGK